ncbi:hypothetical protein C7I36_04725 [Zobellella taiwanensis]|uniref:Uncharacterized protein n=1 Tax=Zobellella taiwanensis TaxID=347535 RepID=A0A2P7R5A9_9GAMM|nr:hypothetical protein [Zobellella taiwanensis]PSJ45378.1 hypothetical protein C7I36_04725 [Zobellella taiwanensis]
MSKLFQLKKWLTVPEAADRLSSSFGEKVTEADVLRLALDGHLILSVSFPNKAVSKKRAEVDEDYSNLVARLLMGELRKEAASLCDPLMLDILVEHFKMSAHVADFIIKNNFTDLISPYKYTAVVSLGEGGEVFDLPLIGAERLDVEHRYQMLTGGPEITLHCLEGVFVIDAGGDYYQLQDRFSDLPSDKLPSFERPKPFSERDYYPAATLPEDALWVVRTEALLDLERRILQGEETDSPAGKSQTKPLINEDRWFDVLGVMAILLYENTDDPRMRKGENNINMAGIKGAVIDKAQKLGLSAERLENLNKDISAALKILQYPPPKN